MYPHMRTGDLHGTGAAACLQRLEPARPLGLHPELDRWRENVGDPVALDVAPEAAPGLRGVDVLCWNVAIGLGRLDAVLDRIMAGLNGGAGPSPDRPLVVLVQEAYRADTSIPAAAAGAHHGGHAPAAPDRADIVQVARRLGLSIRYSPSMRNGAHPSDRGNAVLSTVRLADAHAVLLPHVRQRRVAVAARVHGHADLTFVSAHLDTWGTASRAGGAGAPRRLGAGRTVQAEALAAALGRLEGCLVVGADLNSYRGMTDPAVRTLVAAGLHPARRVGRWRHTFHTPLRLLLDHVFYRSAGRIAGAAVTRLDEAPADRSRGVFGSDHHPLLAHIEFGGG
jgi:endonuclease/exonuclease/phosphatase family metal-dependent hydrolase